MEQESLFEDGEIIIEEVRKHFLVYVEDVFIHFFGCALFVGMTLFFAFSGESAGPYIAYVLMFFVLVFWVSFFYAWTKNYFDVWYITNKHIIAVNQKEILKRDEAFMELRRIQDVFFEKEGLLQTWFGYGILRIQSAGTEQEFVIENVQNVELIAHRIMELRDKAHNNERIV